ncbi:MAG: hypothetical protein NC217_02955 [Muribaculaceae bacterium]|nr:hypothetical protein [Muribaculaceae bacterium]
MKTDNLTNGRRPELVVMLTYNDYTVENAADIFNQCRQSKAQYWGMKECPLPLEEMKRIYAEMKACGKTTVMEVVCYDEESGMAGAQRAVECQCDILMGTKYFKSIAELCHRHGIKYMPFVGQIEGRPSVLSGDVGDIVSEAQQALAEGADGIDILGYRYVGNPLILNKALTDNCNGNICIAGSIDSYRRLDEVKQAGAWGFTIGSAFFDNKFGDDFATQIDKVVDYLS